ncbi:Carboxylesterase [Radiomyces spectabilis]|uniref:Carboxylesterase n=1 Tax=Radiomyces spectabilis TaxID=64574 RepID=UPI00221EC8D0|nr:Carboxylesterase [Radiomyces spectabilis]KAI8378013.1 Carboxylesterase [Radiomyces spectabilis]
MVNTNKTPTRTVRTSSGLVQGYVDTDQECPLEVFLGIPYVHPPIGDRRFRPPEPLKDDPSSTEVLSCMDHTPAAPQTPMPFDTLMSIDIGVQSEDCLHLNIWSPAQDADARLPVLVWFHSGACLR